MCAVPESTRKIPRDGAFLLAQDRILGRRTYKDSPIVRAKEGRGSLAWSKEDHGDSTNTDDPARSCVTRSHGDRVSVGVYGDVVFRGGRLTLFGEHDQDRPHGLLDRDAAYSDESQGANCRHRALSRNNANRNRDSEQRWRGPHDLSQS